MSLVILRRRISDLKPSFDDLLSSDYRNHPRYRGVVGHWILNESGGVTAYDISGNGKHGTLTGGPTWTQGQFGSALSFDGSDDYVSMGNVLIPPIPNMTLAAWFSINSFTNYNWLISRDSGNGFRRDYSIGVIDSTTLTYSYDDPGDPVYKSVTVTALNTNQWYYLVVTLDSSDNATFYLNGVSVGSATGATHTDQSSNDLHFGRSHVTNSGPNVHANALIDNIRVCNRVLSADEVMSLYLDGFLEFQQLEFYRWIRRVAPVSIIPVRTTSPIYRPTLIGARTI